MLLSELCLIPAEDIARAQKSELNSTLMQTFPIARYNKKEASGIVYGYSHPWGKIKDLGSSNFFMEMFKIILILLQVLLE